MKKSKAVLSVRFESTYGPEELKNAILRGIQDYKNVPGLIQKYYLSDENSQTLGGIYVFENKDARSAFWNSDLAKAFPANYGIKPETLRIEELEVKVELTEMTAA